MLFSEINVQGMDMMSCKMSKCSENQRVSQLKEKNFREEKLPPIANIIYFLSMIQHSCAHSEMYFVFFSFYFMTW